MLTHSENLVSSSPACLWPGLRVTWPTWLVTWPRPTDHLVPVRCVEISLPSCEERGQLTQISRFVILFVLFERLSTLGDWTGCLQMIVVVSNKIGRLLPRLPSSTWRLLTMRGLILRKVFWLIIPVSTCIQLIIWWLYYIIFSIKSSQGELMYSLCI